MKIHQFLHENAYDVNSAEETEDLSQLFIIKILIEKCDISFKFLS